MKSINGLVWYEVDNNKILIISSEFKGKPSIYCEYDMLIISEKSFNKYRDVLMPKFLLDKGWKPKINFI